MIRTERHNISPHVGGVVLSPAWIGRRRQIGAVIIWINNGIRSHRQDLFHDRVKGRTARTLNAQKVPLTSGRFGLTIVAHNIDNPLQVGRHGMFGNIPGPGLPGRRHGLLTDHRLFANRTTVIKAGQFAEAVGVNRVTTGKVLRRLATAKHVLAADGTVVLVLVFEALVRLEYRDRNAHAAFVAVTKGFHTADTAETALNAVKGLLGH